MFFLVHILYPDTPSFTNIHMLVSILWNLQPRKISAVLIDPKGILSPWGESDFESRSKPIYSAKLFAECSRNSLPWNQWPGTTLKSCRNLFFFFFWVLFFLADADLLIEFPMIQEGSDWRDVVVFLPCFGERFDVVSCPSKPCGLESPDRGIVASHTKPNHYEHHIVFKAVACWIYIYIYWFYVFVEGECWKFQCRSQVCAGFGWMVFVGAGKGVVHCQ